MIFKLLCLIFEPDFHRFFSPKSLHMKLLNVFTIIAQEKEGHLLFAGHVTYFILVRNITLNDIRVDLN